MLQLVLSILFSLKCFCCKQTFKFLKIFSLPVPYQVIPTRAWACAGTSMYTHTQSIFHPFILSFCSLKGTIVKREFFYSFLLTKARLFLVAK